MSFLPLRHQAFPGGDTHFGRWWRQPPVGVQETSRSAARNASVVARSRTARRRWSGPRPGNVSPRSTATPASARPETRYSRSDSAATASFSASSKADGRQHATVATPAKVDTDHGTCTARSRSTTSGEASTYPARSPARPHVFVVLRSTTPPGTPAARLSLSPGTASRNASSPTSSRPGRASSRGGAAGGGAGGGGGGGPAGAGAAAAGASAG